MTASQATALTTIQQLDPIYVDVSQSASDALRLREALQSGNVKSNGRTAVKTRFMASSTVNAEMN